METMNSADVHKIDTLKVFPKAQRLLCNGVCTTALGMPFFVSISSRVNRFSVLRSYESMKELTAPLKCPALSTLTTGDLDNLINLKKMSHAIMRTVSHFLQDFKRAVNIWLQSCSNIYKKNCGRNYGSTNQP